MAPVPPETYSPLEEEDPDRAESRLRERLAADPSAVEDWVELAGLLCRRQALAEAVPALERALEGDPRHRLALTRLGGVLQHLGQLDRARAVLQRAVAAHPDHSEAWCNLGVVHLLAGDAASLEAARESLERSLALRSDQPLALRALVRALELQGNTLIALEPLQRLVELEPQRWPDLLRLGDALMSQRQPQAAERAYRQSLAALERSAPPPPEGGQPPAAAGLHSNLGASLLAQGQKQQARQAFERALELWPPYPEAASNLGMVLRLLGEPQEALDACDRAVGLRPDLRAAHTVRGLALRDLGRGEEALAALREALRLAPDQAAPIGDLALLLQDLGHCSEALPLFDQAVARALPPDADPIRLNRGMCRLLQSDLQQGWDDYEARLSKQDTLLLQPQGPRWRGEDPDGAPLLLVGEQGFGDMIQFLRYAPLLRRRCGAVAVALPATLIPLAEAAGLADAIWTPARAEEHRGPWLPLLSVCHTLRTPPTQLAPPTPYLQVPQERIAHWRPWIRSGAEPRIALHWQGNPEVESGSLHGRSLPLERLAPLTGVGSLRLVSLQKGPGSEQRHHCSFADHFIERQDLVDTAWDFLETAAILHSCDLVITSDSGLAHLAGALGLPVWLLLKQVPEWRWGLRGETTPWYPTMRLYRQQRPGDWDVVIARVCRDLPAALAERAAGSPHPGCGG